jgi:hypothetical protein
VREFCWHAVVDLPELWALCGVFLCTHAYLSDSWLQVRRSVRPLFQGSKATALFYDLLTCLFTRMAIAYLAFSFVALELPLSLHGLR